MLLPDNKVTMIVGACPGIEWASAKLFALEGTSVVIAARCDDRLNELAEDIGNLQSFCVVSTAIGGNPVAFPIPCHRVIQRSGKIGGYMRGPDRKSAVIGREATQTDVQNA